ncbi:MAG: hypothetical protein IKW70_00560, partial [Verrucomicrobia bacterium]|nr:hypothetical protein [Verrucomicrobiota bacterium]
MAKYALASLFVSYGYHKEWQKINHKILMKISDHKTLGIFCLAASLMMLNAFQSQAAMGNTFIEGDLEYTVLTEDSSTGTVSAKLNNYSAQNVS